MILKLIDGSRTVPEIIKMLRDYVRSGRLQIRREIVGGQTEREYEQNLTLFFEHILHKFVKLAFFVKGEAG